EVPEARAAEHGVGDRMAQHVGIAVALKTPFRFEDDAAEHQRAPVGARVNVVTDAGPQAHSVLAELRVSHASASSRSWGVVILKSSASPSVRWARCPSARTGAESSVARWRAAAW